MREEQSSAARFVETRPNDQTSAEITASGTICACGARQLVSAKLMAGLFSDVHNPTQGCFCCAAAPMFFIAALRLKGNRELSCYVRGRDYAIQLIDPKRLRGSQSSGTRSRKRANCCLNAWQGCAPVGGGRLTGRSRAGLSLLKR